MSAIATPPLAFERSPAAATTAAARGPAAGPFLALNAVVGATSIGGAIAINQGTLDWVGIQWLAVGMLLLLGGLILCRAKLAARTGWAMVERALLLCVVFQIVHVALIGPTTTPSRLPMLGLHIGLLVLVAGLFIGLFTQRMFLGSGLFIGAFAVLGFGGIWVEPGRQYLMDVVHFQHFSSEALVNGQSPYEVRYRNVYHPNLTGYGPGVVDDQGWLKYSFPYPPTTLLMVAPGYLAGDVRYAHLASLAAAAGLLVLTGRSRLALLAGALLLTSPRSIYVLQQGWTEPTLILLVALVLWVQTCRPRARWLALGLLLSGKQYLVLLGPLLPMLHGTWGRGWKWLGGMLAAGLVVVATMLPFALWSPVGFYQGVVEWQFVQPYRNDSLSFAALKEMAVGGVPTGMAGFIAAGFAMLLAWWKAPRSFAGLLMSAAVVFACFFAFNKQAFCNYYYFVIGLCCCAVVGLSVERSGVAHFNQAQSEAVASRL